MWGFRQGQVEVQTHYEPAEGRGSFDVGQFVVGRPWVTGWSEALLGTCREAMGPEAMGYRLVRREWTGLVSVWARPLVVWAYLVGCEWAARRVWLVKWRVRWLSWWLVPGKDLG